MLFSSLLDFARGLSFGVNDSYSIFFDLSQPFTWVLNLVAFGKGVLEWSLSWPGITEDLNVFVNLIVFSLGSHKNLWLKLVAEYKWEMWFDRELFTIIN